MKKIFHRLLTQNLHWLFLLMLFTYTSTQIVVTCNQMLSDAIDQVMEGQTEGILTFSFIITLLLLTISGFFSHFFKHLCSSQIAVRIQTAFRKEAGNHLLDMEFCYFDEHNSASIMNHFLLDISTVSDYYSSTFPELLSTFIGTGVIAWSIWKIDYTLILFFIISFPVTLLLSKYSTDKEEHLVKLRWKLTDHLNDIIYDSIQGIETEKSYCMESQISQKLHAANADLFLYDCKRNRLSAIPWSLIYVVQYLPHVLLGTFALYRVLNGNLTLGEMSYFILMLDRIVKPLSDFPSLISAARTAYVSKMRLEEFMNTPTEPSGNITVSVSSSPVISFEHVTFSYQNEQPVLKDIQLTVPAGSHIAFVGASGEGKTTLFKLLCGFYQPQRGNILLYGTPLENWNRCAMRSLIALVSQNIYLFPESIAWNVSCGNPDIRIEEIISACKAANIHERIMQFPTQYHTFVGERGSYLSGGEKQRISLARAFLKNAPILLLDEPTSAMDTQTESLIQEALEHICKDRTVITIAHRLSTIENADTVYTLSHGTIVKQDKHSILK